MGLVASDVCEKDYFVSVVIFLFKLKLVQTASFAVLYVAIVSYAATVHVSYVASVPNRL